MGNDVTGRRILVVEDDADQRVGLAELLRAHGHRVIEAASAEGALEALAGEPVDLVVADYQLGGATGAWLARIVGRTLRPSAPRAILVTGHDSIRDAEGLTVLRKPIDVDRFLVMVDRALDEPPQDIVPIDRPAQRIAFIMYVTASLSSRKAQRTLQALLAGYDPSQVSLTVVNLTAATGQQAEEHRVVVTPTLLKTFPAPRVWVTGELDPPLIVERLLQQAGVEARS
jgi:CheY-like chemotaxis protein